RSVVCSPSVLSHRCPNFLCVLTSKRDVILRGGAALEIEMQQSSSKVHFSNEVEINRNFTSPFFILDFDKAHNFSPPSVEVTMGVSLKSSAEIMWRGRMSQAGYYIWGGDQVSLCSQDLSHEPKKLDTPDPRLTPREGSRVPILLLSSVRGGQPGYWM